ncbi:axoneme-associated protein mst101(2)-like [Lineus longissimus]|uniref:axoneme-associated protein mst101(2)-like n=1 Tax=Lineus longissimus TaxID=88925 RepID=UPI00315D3100
MADHAESNGEIFGRSDDEMVNDFQQSLNESAGDSEGSTSFPDQGGSLGIQSADKDSHISDSSSDYTYPVDGERNADVEALVTYHEKYKGELEYEKEQHEKAMALRENEFAEERIGWRETLEKEHEATEALAEENARKDAELIEVKREFARANEENVEAERERCNQKLYEQQEQFDERLRVEMEKKDQTRERLIIQHGNEVDAVRNQSLDEIRSLRGEVEQLRKKVREAGEKTNVATEENVSAVAKIGELSNDMRKKEAELTRVKTKLVEQEKEHEALLNQQKAEQKEHRHIDRENCRMKIELEALERRLEDEKKSHTVTRQALARNSDISSDVSMKCVVDAHAQLIEDVKEEMREKEGRYQQRIEELQLSVEEARKGRYEDLEEKHEMDLERMEAVYRDKVLNLERQKEDMITVHRRELDAYQKKLVDAQNESCKDKDKLVREIRNLQQRIKQMKTERKEMQWSLEAKAALCDRQEGATNDLKKELGQAKEDKKALEEKNAAESIATDKQHEEALACKVKEISDLREKQKLKLMNKEVEYSAKQEEAKAIMERQEVTHRAEVEKERQAHAAYLQEVRRDKEEAVAQTKLDAKDREQLMMSEHDKLIQYLKDEIADLKGQLEKARERLDKEQEERRKDMTDARDAERRNREEFEAKNKKIMEDHQADMEAQKAGYEKKLREMELQIGEMNENLAAERDRHAQVLQDERRKAEKERCDAVNIQTEAHVKSENASREERRQKDEKIDELKREIWRLNTSIPPEKKKMRRLSLSSLSRKKRKDSHASLDDTRDGAHGELLQESYEGPCNNEA